MSVVEESSIFFFLCFAKKEIIKRLAAVDTFKVMGREKMNVR